jgi:Tripartite tricarboxylate transporter TctA family.
LIGVETLFLVAVLAFISAIVYILVGVLPGTDETATMAPIALALLIAGLDPLIVLAWFLASIIAFKAADAIPVALAGIPGGVMAVPQVPDAVEAKRAGKADVILRKGVTSSMVASFIALVLVLVLAFYIKPLGDFLNIRDDIAGVAVPRWFWLLLGGLLILALTSKNKLLALLTIPTFAILVQGLRLAYEKNVIISFFLGITIGPLVVELLEVLSGYARDRIRRGYMSVKLEPVSVIPLNPLKHLSREELAHVLFWSPITSVLAMVMSPVGLTILIGDLIKGLKRTPLEASILAYTVRDGVKNATYIGGLLIPLLVIGSPTGPMSAGPGLPFFTEIGGVVPAKYITSNYSHLEISVALLLSAVIASLVVYPILIRYSRRLTLLVFKSVPAESLYGLFLSIVVLLAYYDAGLRGVLGVLVVSMVSGILWRNGVSLGVLFMTLVAAPTIFAFIKLI